MGLNHMITPHRNFETYRDYIRSEYERAWNETTKFVETELGLRVKKKIN